jgi:hypothetical protein
MVTLLEHVPHFKDVLGYLPNLHILEKETFVLDDVTFIGGTLWTDMNRRDISEPCMIFLA